MDPSVKNAETSDPVQWQLAEYKRVFGQKQPVKTVLLIKFKEKLIYEYNG